MLESLDQERSALVLIRHGQSHYTDEFPDLTPLGVSQIQQTARDLEDVIKKYAHLRVFSSPAVRALGSARVFLDTLGIDNQEITIIEDIAPVEIKNRQEFLNYLKKHENLIEGSFWLREEFFDSPDNTISERRSEVERRAYGFLEKYPSLVSNGCLDDITCDIAFSHYEIMVNYMWPLFDSPNGFPIETERGPLNGEVVILQPGQYNPRLFTVAARSRLAYVQLDPLMCHFTRLV